MVKLIGFEALLTLYLQPYTYNRSQPSEIVSKTPERGLNRDGPLLPLGPHDFRGVFVMFV